MQDSEVLIPKGETVNIGDRQYKIGKLSLKQSILFSRFIVRTVLSSQDKLREFEKRTKESESNIEDIMTLVDLINPEDLFELYGILLKENDRGFLLANLDLEIGSEIIALVCENNNFEKIKKNFQRIMKATTKKPEEKQEKAI